jgi:hypothetical protein
LKWKRDKIWRVTGPLFLREGPNLRCKMWCPGSTSLTAVAQLLLHVSMGTFGGTRAFAVYRAICLCVESAPPSNFFYPPMVQIQYCKL